MYVICILFYYLRLLLLLYACKVVYIYIVSMAIAHVLAVHVHAHIYKGNSLLHIHACGRLCTEFYWLVLVSSLHGRVHAPEEKER